MQAGARGRLRGTEAAEFFRGIGARGAGVVEPDAGGPARGQDAGPRPSCVGDCEGGGRPSQ